MSSASRNSAPSSRLRPSRSQQKPIGKKPTRAQTLTEILKLQAEHPPTRNEHTFQQTTGYIKCGKCGMSIHKRANEEAFNSFMNSACIDEQYSQPHEGHKSHQFWQTGNRIHCRSCGIKAHLDADGRIILSANLKRECKGAATRGSPDLKEWFQATAGKQTEHQQDSPCEHSSRKAAGSDLLSPPAPRCMYVM